MWKKTELSYMAGIIDGEGYITAIYTPKTRRFNPYVGVTSTDRILVDWIKNRFGGYVYERQTPKEHPHYKKKYEWVARQSDIDTILPEIIPYLVIKKDRAIVFLEFRETFKNRAYWKVPEEVEKVRHSLFRKIKEMNK